MTRVWRLMLGKFGENEQRAFDDDVLVTGWTLGDLSNANDVDAVREIVAQAHPDESPGTIKNWAVQLNQFRNQVEEGDFVIVPAKTNDNKPSIGKFVGPYVHADGKSPARRVEWLQRDVPRENFGQDLLYSIGAAQTFCSIRRNEALARVQEIARTRRDPGANLKTDQIDVEDALEIDVESGFTDVAQLANDQIERHIVSNFDGHSFTELIADILRTRDYTARVSPPGADKGVDIVAGRGAFGFESPKLVVQVKSGDIIADDQAVQSLLGNVARLQADQGLLVSWNGFRTSVKSRINDQYFHIRLWGRDDILKALFVAYPGLPEQVRAELPLKPTWTLVLDD